MNGGCSVRCPVLAIAARASWVERERRAFGHSFARGDIAECRRLHRVSDDEPVADLVGGGHVERVQQFGERYRRRPGLTGYSLAPV